MNRFVLYIGIAFLILSLAGCGDMLETIDPPAPEELILINSIYEGDTITRHHVLIYQIMQPPDKTPVPAIEEEFSPEGTETEEIIIDLAEENEIQPDTPGSTEGDTPVTQNPPDLLIELNIYDSQDTLIVSLEHGAETEFENFQNFSDLLPPDLVTGQYSLEVKLWRGTDLLEEKRVNFYFANEPFLINSIESFPPVIFPNITVDLLADLTVPPESDPYLRWKENGRELDAGLLSTGLGATQWTAPSEVGIYSLSLELFPLEPKDSLKFIHSSNITMDIELFVSKLEKPTHRNLFPVESYYALFHFAGDTQGVLRTGTERTREITAQPFGNPLLVMESDDLAYKLNPNSGFQIPEFILPLNAGWFVPFSLNLGLTPALQTGRTGIISFWTEDRSFQLELFIDTDSRYKASLIMNDKEIILESNLRAIPRHTLLSFSVLPEDTSLIICWYEGSRPVNTEKITLEKTELSSSGQTKIGGFDGYSGLIDELGIYYRNEWEQPDINGNLWAYSIEQNHPGLSVFAEGFDGLSPHPELTLSGDTEIKNSLLLLKSGAGLSLPLPNATEDNLDCKIRFTLPEYGGLKIIYESSTLLELTGKGILRAADESLSFEYNSPELQFQLTPEAVILPTEENPLSLALPEIPADKNLILEFYNQDTRPLEIDSLTILRIPAAE